MVNSKQDKELAALTCLYEITRVLASSTDLRDCLKKAMAILSSSFDFKNATVTIVNPRTGQSEIEVAHGMSGKMGRSSDYKFRYSTSM
ncbi:MAG: hypothetical protein P1P81_03430 [Desulfobulbales bacterium]|nr:hypothetical protein [Desulfobulbales bacterium]